MPIGQRQRHGELDRPFRRIGEQPPCRRLARRGRRGAAVGFHAADLHSLLGPERVLQPLGGAAQAREPILRRRAQIFGLLQRILQAPDLDPQQGQLGTQARGRVGARPRFILVHRVLFPGRAAPVLSARHRRSPVILFIIDRVPPALWTSSVPGGRWRAGREEVENAIVCMHDGDTRTEPRAVSVTSITS